MSNHNSTIKTTVVLDATQAQQEIVKLNAVATDSTQELEDRVEAKNKAVDIQNKLSKDAVDTLENELKALKALGNQEKQVEKTQKKLNSAKIKATKASENGAKQQRKLNDALKDGRSATKNLDDSTGGLLSKMKAFITNPIGIAIVAIVSAFKFLSEAIGRSEEASSSFSKIGQKLAGIMNGLLAVVEPLVIFIGEKLLEAMNNPVQAIKDLGTAIVDNIINRFKSILVLGDAIAELFKGNFSEAAKLAQDALIQFTTGVEDGTEKIKSFIDESVEVFNKAARATESLANKEKILLKNRQDLEKQQLISLRLAEEQRQIRDDTSKSIEKRIEANTKLGQILEEQALAEMAIAQQNLDIANQEVAASGNAIENLEAQGDAEIKLLEIQERISGQRSEQLVNEVGLLKERADKIAEDVILAEERAVREVESQLELDELLLQRKRDNNESILAEELSLLERRREQELSAEDLTESERALIRAQFRDLENEAKKADEEMTKVSEEAKTQSVKDAAAIGIAAAGEAFGISQELKTAEMIMEAPKAIGSSFSQAAATYPFPLSLAMGAAGAAGTIIPIIKGLSDIKKTRFSKSKGGPKGGSISSSAASPSVATPAIAAASTEAIENISANNASRLGIDPSLGNAANANAANSIAGGSSRSIVFSESKYGDFKDQVKFKEEKITIG